jgi:hypothetical protein
MNHSAGKQYRSALTVLAAIAAATIGPAAAQGVPGRFGQCVTTTIADIGERLEDGRTNAPIAGSGSAVTFANKLYQVSYNEIDEIAHSHVGDRVLMCLVLIPTNCPKGDIRGKIYTTTNLRTMESWTLPDSEHSCGGA